LLDSPASPHGGDYCRLDNRAMLKVNEGKINDSNHH